MIRLNLISDNKTNSLIRVGEEFFAWRHLHEGTELLFMLCYILASLPYYSASCVVWD